MARGRKWSAAAVALVLAAAGARGAGALRVVGDPGLIRERAEAGAQLEAAEGALGAPPLPELEEPGHHGHHGRHGGGSHAERCKHAQEEIKRRSAAAFAAIDKAEKAGKITKKQAAEKRAFVKKRTARAKRVWEHKCGKHEEGEDLDLLEPELDLLEGEGPGGKAEKCKKAAEVLKKKYAYEMAAIDKAEKAGKITKKQAAEKRAFVKKRFARAKRVWEHKCGKHEEGEE